MTGCLKENIFGSILNEKAGKLPVSNKKTNKVSHYHIVKLLALGGHAT